MSITSFSLDGDNAGDGENDERKRWNRKYREAAIRETGESKGTKEEANRRLRPDPLLVEAFTQFVTPVYPRGGKALDVAGGAGRHAIWLAKHGWDVTLIDISDIGVEQARQNSGQLASRIHFVVDDLTRFKASQIGKGIESDVQSDLSASVRLDAQFDLVLAFFYLDRKIFPELLRAICPGGLLIYKTYTATPGDISGEAKNPKYLLQPGELAHLAKGTQILHYREAIEVRATAELVARKITSEADGFSFI